MVYSDEVVYDVTRPDVDMGVLQICDLENDRLICSVVIKVASFHIIHGLRRHIEKVNFSVR